MSAPELAAILAAGVAMGFINNLGGGGGLIGLAALQIAVGLAPMEANVALRLSALNIGLLGMVGFRSRGMHIPRKAWGWGLATVPGALCGSWMALHLEEWVYQASVLVVKWQTHEGLLLCGHLAPTEGGPPSRSAEACRTFAAALLTLPQNRPIPHHPRNGGAV